MCKPFLSFICAILLSSIDASAQWTKITPACEGAYVPSVNCLLSFNNTLIAGTINGIYTSEDGGLHWAKGNDGLATTWDGAIASVYSLACDGVTVYAGTDSGLVNSLDGGHHWVRVDSGWTYKYGGNVYPVSRISIVIVNDGVIYAADQDAGIFRSRNGGATWLHIRDSVYPHTLSSLTTWGTRLLEDIEGQNLFVSSDHGDQWQEVASPKQAFYSVGIGSCLGQGDTLWVGTTFFNNYFRVGTWFSIDMGKSWTCVDSAFGDNQSVTTLIVAGDCFFAYAIDRTTYSTSRFARLRRSTDRGATWTTCSLTNDTSVNNHLSVRNIVTFNDALIAATNMGFYGSRNHGETWSVRDTGATQISHGTLLALDRMLLAGSAGSMFRSTDEGEHWSSLLSPFGKSTTVYAFCKTSFGIYAGTDAGYSTYDPAVYFSIDTGTSWKDGGITVDGYAENVIYAFAERNDSVWAVGNAQVFVKVKDVHDWSSLGIIPDTGQGYGTSTTLAAGINNIVIGTNAGLYVSTNGGRRWMSIINGELAGCVNAVTFSGDAFYAGDVAGNIVKSADDGVHWFSVLHGPGAANVIAAMYGVVFVATSTGIYCSSDAGNNWRNVSGAITDTVFTSMQITRNYLYVSTATDIWRGSLADMGITAVKRDAVSVTPEDVSLEQNYPNPFSETTTLTYRVALSEPVHLTVLDALGNQMGSPVNEYVEAGTHAVQIHSNGWPSGYYVVRLSTRQGVRTQGMLIAR